MPFRLPPSPTSFPTARDIARDLFAPNAFGTRWGHPISVPGDALLPPPPIILPQERAVMRTVFAIADAFGAFSPDAELAPKTGVTTVGDMRKLESFRRSENVEDARDIPVVPLALPIEPARRSWPQAGRIDRLVVPPSPPLERVSPMSEIARDAGIDDLIHARLSAPPPPPARRPVSGIRQMIDNLAAFGTLTEPF
jgi:hypothetical protein